MIILFLSVPISDQYDQQITQTTFLPHIISVIFSEHPVQNKLFYIWMVQFACKSQPVLMEDNNLPVTMIPKVNIHTMMRRERVGP